MPKKTQNRRHSPSKDLHHMNIFLVESPVENLHHRTES
uniref:Uncharacterized protein n=1 Tax=Rhizophora mucronata TaxID=61149 RepID=A0A2P2PJP3_RHIMU